MELDNAYRRGTVFGLTIAEIFILLIFLILLALLGLANHWREKEEEYELSREAALARDQLLFEWRDVIEFHTPDEIKTLHSRATSLEQQIRSYEDLIEEYGSHDQEKRTLLDTIRTLRTENESLQEEARALRAESEGLRNENMELSEETSMLREERDALRGQAEVAGRHADRARAELRILRHKGQNPPCWYETVAAAEGRTREKAHYIFNIAVYDEAMVVDRLPVPSGGAYDDGGLAYAEEVERLGLDEIPYDTRLSDAELEQYMRPIYRLGDSRYVRSYRCIFYVKVWDETSLHAKVRWKHAHDNVLEGLFGTYVVKEDPWPGSP